MSEIKVMTNDEIISFCIKKDYEIFKRDEEIERLHSIIKEVREYIENDMKLKDNFMIDEDGAKYLLEILDKDNKEW